MNDADSVYEEPAQSFGELGVPGLLVRLLAADGKKTAFPIQQDTLPDSLAGRDVLGRGQTGSGKTLAFGLPLVSRLSSMDRADDQDFPRDMDSQTLRKSLRFKRGVSKYMPHPRGLVLAPTRELANQISDVLTPLADAYGMAVTTVYGGVKYERQFRALDAGADIVVACPGRLEDLIEQQALTLADVRIVVLDEADEMADMGFLPPIKRILKQIRQDAQHMLFSATLDHGVDEVVSEFLHDPKVHSVDEVTSNVDSMTHHLFLVSRNDKAAVVRELASGRGRRILFTRTKFQAKKLAHTLTQSGIPAAELHGNLSQHQRDRNLQVFESGQVNVLVATDDERILKTVEGFGGKAVMTRADHKSGTDRCYEAYVLQGKPYDVVVNIQGDEPFIQPQQLEAVKACFEDPQTEIATLVKPFTPADGWPALENVNSPKVVVNRRMQALYFSRSIIPYQRNKDKAEWLKGHVYYKHIGLYAYKADVLKELTSLPQSPLELAESLEQLRWLENGYTIKVGISEIETIGIDTPADLEAAEAFLKNRTKRYTF